jgi:hypothetical protein
MMNVIIYDFPIRHNFLANLNFTRTALLIWGIIFTWISGFEWYGLLCLLEFSGLWLYKYASINLE